MTRISIKKRQILPRVVCCWVAAAAFGACVWAGDPSAYLDIDSQVTLSIPALSAGPLGPGKRVAVTPPEYAGTTVFHTLYLPEAWRQDGHKLPIIFEYTGNHYSAAGSTGEPEDAGLGFGLSGGKYIWVSMPYIDRDHTDNAVTWWGDEQATIDYAKKNVPRMIRECNADPNAVFLCGFSRGAIGVNYIGLHDDEIARLWTAFITHDHFDGVRAWGRTEWGSPLAQYRKGALKRLQRVAGRPYLVSQHGDIRDTEQYIRSVLSHRPNFTFSSVNTEQALGRFPNAFAKHAHNDRWLLTPSSFRTTTWQWMNRAMKRASDRE